MHLKLFIVMLLVCALPSAAQAASSSKFTKIHDSVETITPGVKKIRMNCAFKCSSSSDCSGFHIGQDMQCYLHFPNVNTQTRDDDRCRYVKGDVPQPTTPTLTTANTTEGFTTEEPSNLPDLVDEVAVTKMAVNKEPEFENVSSFQSCVSVESSYSTSFRFPFKKASALRKMTVSVEVCPPNGIMKDGLCYILLESELAFVAATALSHCAASSGTIANIKAEDAAFLQSWMISKGVNVAFLLLCKLLGSDPENPIIDGAVECLVPTVKAVICIIPGKHKCDTDYTSSRSCFKYFPLPLLHTQAIKHCSELGGSIPKMETEEDNKIVADSWAIHLFAQIGINDFSGSWKNYDGTDRSPDAVNKFNIPLATWPLPSGIQFAMLTGSWVSYQWTPGTLTAPYICQFQEGSKVTIRKIEGKSETDLVIETFEDMFKRDVRKYYMTYTWDSSEVIDGIILDIEHEGDRAAVVNNTIRVCYNLQ